MSVQPPPPQGPPGPAPPPGVSQPGPAPPPPGISPGPAPLPGVSASAKRKAADAGLSGPAPPPRRSKPGKEHRKTWENGTFREGPLWNLGDVVNVEFNIAGSNGGSDHWYATVTKIWHAGTTTAGKQGLTVRYHCDGTTDFVDFKDVAYCLTKPEGDIPKPKFTVDMSAFQVEQGLINGGVTLSPKVPGDGVKRSMAWTEADNSRLIALIIPYWPSPSPNWIQLAHDYNAGSTIGDRTLESIKARFKRLRDKGRLGPYRPYVPGSSGGGGAGMSLFVGVPGAPGAPVPAPPGKGSALDLMATAAASAGDADGAATILAMAASRSQKNKKPKPPLPPGPPPASAFLRDVAIAPRKKTDRSTARTKTTVKREKKKVDPFEQSSVQQDREER